MTTTPHQPPAMEKSRRLQFHLRSAFAFTAVAALSMAAVRFFEKPSVKNLHLVQPGMTREQVYEIIGYPSCLNGGLVSWTEMYFMRHGTAHVNFIHGRVDGATFREVEE